MTRDTPRPPKVLSGPPCETCGGATRIVRIEPHKRFKRRQRWTVECTACGARRDVEMLAPRRPH